MRKLSPNVLISDDEYTLKRDYLDLIYNNDNLNGYWVYRDPTGDIIDYSIYQHILIDLYNIKVV